MAFSVMMATYCSPFLDKNSCNLTVSSSIARVSYAKKFSSVRFPLSDRRKSLSFRCSSVSVAPAPDGVKPAISLSDNALKHLNKMRSERNEDLCLRIGVRQGGCSGMSYTMNFEDRANTRPEDSIIEYKGFVIVKEHCCWDDPSGHLVAAYGLEIPMNFCDPKSLLFLFGMQLDYSDALIGGGFSFKNPNATQTCGCGKSFAAEM